MRFLAVAFLFLVWTAADAREIMTNDGRVIIDVEKNVKIIAAVSSRNFKTRKQRDTSALPIKNINRLESGAHSNLITEARRWLGSTARQMGLHRVTLWCATFLNRILDRAGIRGTHSDLAFSFLHWGRPAPGPAPGVIAVMRRRGGGHVGIVTQVLGHGRIRVISGNHSHRVREAIYSTRRVIAWRVP